MRVIICDRCKEKITNGEIGAILMETRGERGTIMKSNPYKDWDLCPSCMADIHEYIQEPLKEKPKATIKPKRFAKADDIVELAKAGKTAKEISLELGCALPTVYKYTKGLNADDEPQEDEPETEE